ncbi:hypothetical protein HIM_00952 [Hirsutella minnesotensis 3608]|nr:hypothetical protein HIM_00952 [Hirsutella minnesotensis 3608]
MRTIFATILLAGAALAAPAEPTSYKTTCTQRSQRVRDWTVGNFDYHASYIFTTPAHQNSWGYVNFTLENAAVPYKAQCSGASSQLNDFFYGTMPYKCTLPEPYTGDEATFLFSRPSGQLNLTQKWNCLSEGSRFEAKGGVQLNLKCKETQYQNPDWKLGQIYSTRNIDCEHVTVKSPVTEMTGVA